MNTPVLSSTNKQIFGGVVAASALASGAICIGKYINYSALKNKTLNIDEKMENNLNVDDDVVEINNGYDEDVDKLTDNFVEVKKKYEKINEQLNNYYRKKNCFSVTSKANLPEILLNIQNIYQNYIELLRRYDKQYTYIYTRLEYELKQKYEKDNNSNELLCLLKIHEIKINKYLNIKNYKVAPIFKLSIRWIIINMIIDLKNVIFLDTFVDDIISVFQTTLNKNYLEEEYFFEQLTDMNICFTSKYLDINTEITKKFPQISNIKDIISKAKNEINKNTETKSKNMKRLLLFEEVTKRVKQLESDNQLSDNKSEEFYNVAL